MIRIFVGGFDFRIFNLFFVLCEPVCEFGDGDNCANGMVFCLFVIEIRFSDVIVLIFLIGEFFAE